MRSSPKMRSSQVPKFLFPEGMSTDFTIHNLPYGVFSRGSSAQRSIGVAIGDKILDCKILAEKGILPSSFLKPTLNDFMGEKRSVWVETRETLKNLLSDESTSNLNNISSQKGFSLDEVLVSQEGANLHLPAQIGDYTDFYASREHATNVGSMFRDPSKALMPNWLHLPVGYHGRASSVKVSGTAVYRPNGQTVTKEEPEGPPSFGPCRLVDFELEVGAFVGGPATEIGDVLSRKEAEERLFGLVLLNDWSARDIQKWEYVPLGPFLAKNFGTVISPWVVPMLALEPFRTPTPQQDPVPLPYLKHADGEAAGVDVNLSVEIITESGVSKTVSNSNLKYMYWSLAQQLAHHTCNGCNVNPGDLFGTGTISGPTKDSYGSLLEITWGGRDEIDMGNGEIRKFMQDGDTCVMRGFCENSEVRIGFGECSSQVLPAKPYPV